MPKGLLIIDANNLGYAATSSTVLKAGEQETQGVYGVIRALRQSRMAFPHLTPICLWDGISWRKTKFAGYKENRDKVAVTKSDQEFQRIRQSYRSQVPLIKRALKALGVRQVVATNLEADDLAGIMVRRYSGTHKILLVSGDKDWIQLVGPNVSWLDPMRDEKVTLATIEEKLGVKTPAAWLDIKALMGDKSDEIPGVGGIGEVGAKELVNTYGSVNEFLNKAIDGSLPDLPKKFQALADDGEKQAIFSRNMMLMDLNSPHIPKPDELRVTDGDVDLGEFRALCEEFMFHRVLKDFDNWVEPFCVKENA